jgi:hypothetical protein
LLIAFAVGFIFALLVWTPLGYRQGIKDKRNGQEYLIQKLNREKADLENRAKLLEGNLKKLSISFDDRVKSESEKRTEALESKYTARTKELEDKARKSEASIKHLEGIIEHLRGKVSKDARGKGEIPSPNQAPAFEPLQTLFYDARESKEKVELAEPKGKTPPTSKVVLAQEKVLTNLKEGRRSFAQLYKEIRPQSILTAAIHQSIAEGKVKTVVGDEGLIFYELAQGG